MGLLDQKKAASWSQAVAHLRKADRVMAQVIRRVGRCTLAPRRDYFVVLCDSIYSQQLSVRIASILFDRFRGAFPQRRPTPRRTIELLNGNGEALARCGLSRQKRAYLLDLAEH